MESGNNKCCSPGHITVNHMFSPDIELLAVSPGCLRFSLGQRGACDRHHTVSNRETTDVAPEPLHCDIQGLQSRRSGCDPVHFQAVCGLSNRGKKRPAVCHC